VYAEATPLGRWTSWLVEPVGAEKRRLAHGETYKLPRVHGIVADWVHERAMAPSP
jgi:hypothetical protein